ncbi:MAG: endonuclease/exonuclease/phosphatase family protein [Bdellovibrionota bacterium]
MGSHFGFLFDIAVVWSGLELLRTLYASLIYILRDARGLSSVLVGIIPIGVLASSFFAGSWIKYRLGAVVILISVLERFFNPGWIDFGLLCLGVACVPLHFSTNDRSERRPQAWILGILVDYSTHLGWAGWDSTWRQDLPAWLFAGGRALLGLGALIGSGGLRLLKQREAESIKPGAIPVPGAVAMGPLLFLLQICFLNAGWFCTASGWSLPAAGIWQLGVGYVAWILMKMRTGAWQCGIAGALMTAATVMPFDDPFSGVFIWSVGGVGALFLFFHAQRLMPRACRNTRAVAWTVYATMVFFYYAGFGLPFPFTPSMVVTGAAVLATGLILVPNRSLTEIAPQFSGWLPVVLLIFPLMLKLGWWEASEARPPDLITSAGSIRMITFNVNQGFDPSGRLDPESIANVIRDSGAEIVLLQDLDPGLAQWLSQELQMTLRFTSIPEGLWGLATLSRVVPWETQIESLPSDGSRPARSAIVTRYKLGKSDQVLNVLNTQLDQQIEGAAIRKQQTEAIVRLLGTTPNVVIGGDFYAVEEMPELTPLWEHGLRDAANGAIFPTYPARGPRHRIDYLVGTPSLGFTDTVVHLKRVSDHLAVSTTVTVPAVLFGNLKRP